MKDLICIYHGNCADGFGAAWAVREAFGEANMEFYPGTHQEPPPDVAGRDVLMVDFSYKRPVLEGMVSAANSILILDHHKSAAEDLAFLPQLSPSATWGEFGPLGISEPSAAALFDMERSGAGIAWDFFHDAPRPPLIDHIEDRDLWRFALDGTREIQASVFSYPYDFLVWDELMRSPLERLRSEGEAIERKHHKDIAELLRVVQRMMTIAGYEVPVASLPYTLTSDAGHAMAAQGYPFAACYWDTAEGRTFSLRSTEDGMDVSAIAVAFGGGGHRHAAGFRVPLDHDLACA